MDIGCQPFSWLNVCDSFCRGKKPQDLSSLKCDGTILGRFSSNHLSKFMKDAICKGKELQVIGDFRSITISRPSSVLEPSSYIGSSQI